MNFHIITLFPESLDSYIKSSIIDKAIKAKKISISFYNPRDFTKNKHKKVDDNPYAGGPGMVMSAEPVILAIKKAIGRKRKYKIVFFTPRGEKFDNKIAKNYSENYKDIIFICGRYEGIDYRVQEIFKGDEISIGDFVLTGGELPALVLMDSISRQIEGVLGDKDSLEENRITNGKAYTRPEVLKYKGKEYKVPKVLLSGNHKEIEDWRMGK